MTPDRSVSLHVPRFALWVLGVLIIAPWFIVGGILLQRHPTAVSPAQPPAAAGSVANVVGPKTVADAVPTHTGAWGEIEAFRILIEPPEEFILNAYTHTPSQPWTFRGYSERDLTALWQAAKLTPAQLAFLGNAANHEIRRDSIVIRPPTTVIEDLSPEARARIYAALGEFPENVPQFNPYRLRATIAADWLDNAGLPANAIALTKKMFYSRGTATCFSDEAIVLPTMTDDGDRVRYIKALSRKAALMVYLKVGANEDVDKLVSYWGRGGRTKDLKPLLQSVARLPNGGRIDIVHLLPRFARLLVYTYPLPSDKPVDGAHDCHWTSFNFQNDEPDERFSNIERVREVLAEKYYPLPGKPTLGDIIMFVRQDGVVLHSCVYIADDIVFTKNGPAFSVPWLLSPLADVQAFYAGNPGVEMRVFRDKTL